MEWMPGIITVLLLDIVLILTGNAWLIGWVFAALVLWLVCSIVRFHREESRAAREAKRDARRAAAAERCAAELAGAKPFNLRSFMGMGR